MGFPGKPPEVNAAHVLPAIATASAPTLTEGDAVSLSVDLNGTLRTTAGEGGGGTQYAEDTAHVSGDSVTMAGVVQQSADAALSGDGDRSVLQVDGNGYLKVNIKAGAGSGGTAMTDDAAFTPGTSSVTPAGYMFDDVAPDSVNEGDVGVGRMSANRNAYVTLRDAAGNERGLNIDASGRATVVVAGQVTAGTAGAASADVVTIQGIASMTAVKVDGSAVTQPVSMATNTPVGTIAHDSADSGAPIKIGYKAETSPKGITLVADGDRTDAYADADGLQLVKLNTSGADAISESISNTDGNSTAFTNFSAVGSTKNYITGYTAFRTDAGSTMAYIDLRDGTAGSVLWRIPLPPLGGAISPPYNGPCLFKTSANTALAYDVSSALTTVYLSVSGYQSKV